MVDVTYNAAIDRTFRTALRHFKQVLCLHVLKSDNGKSHVGLTRKTETLYKAVLQKIKELVPEFNPVMIMADFEASLRDALKDTFPQCVIKGCWFHYTQAVNRKAKKLGFTVEMTVDI